jgi:hypothetical protein
MTVPRPTFSSSNGAFPRLDTTPPKSTDAADRPFWICWVPTAPMRVSPVRTTGPVHRDWPLTARTAPELAA